jgi:cysteine-rich repeat protein
MEKPWRILPAMLATGLVLLATGCQDPTVESWGVQNSPEGNEDARLSEATDAGSSPTDSSSGASTPTAVAPWHITCGDGTLDRGEGCDDANRNDGDGCSSECCIQPDAPWCGPGGWYAVPAPCHCGDGILDGVEHCDDGNKESADGCSASCEIETGKCGNRVLDETEQCDDGNLARFDGCDENCRAEMSCVLGAAP